MKYKVLLVRNVFESLELEVEAENEDAAADQAFAVGKDTTDWATDPGEIEIDSIELA